MYRFYSKDSETPVTVVADIINGSMVYSAARCSKGDTFTKQMGRTIAEGRLKKGLYFASGPVPKENPGKTFVAVAIDIAKRFEKNADLIDAVKGN